MLSILDTTIPAQFAIRLRNNNSAGLCDACAAVKFRARYARKTSVDYRGWFVAVHGAGLVKSKPVMLTRQWITIAFLPRKVGSFFDDDLTGIDSVTRPTLISNTQQWRFICYHRGEYTGLVFVTRPRIPRISRSGEERRMSGLTSMNELSLACTRHSARWRGRYNFALFVCARVVKWDGSACIYIVFSIRNFYWRKIKFSCNQIRYSRKNTSIRQVRIMNKILKLLFTF